MKIHKNQTIQFSSFFMKIYKNQTLRFYSIFMTPGTWKLTKIRLFNFLQFLWPRVHENSQKSDNSIFFNFHDPGYMKTLKNQTIQFSSIFMTPGTWKSSKIWQFNFLQFSWFLGNNLGKMTPGTWNFTKFQTLWLSSTLMTQGVHKNLQKSEDSIFKKNQTFWFYSIFKKIEVYDFCGFSCTRVHENP